MALDLNPQSPAQAATQDIEQQSANAPSVAIAPGQPEVPMAGAPSPAATPPVHPLVAGTASTALAALNNAPPKPGNFARSVLTGVLHTMSKLGGGAEKVMAGLSQPGGGIDTLGIMAGSKPGQEYNDVQAAAHARHTQGQEDVLFKQKVAQNDIDAKKASFELDHAKNIAKQQDDTYQQGIIDRTAKMLSDAQSGRSINVVSSFLDAKEAAQAASKPGLTAVPVARVPQADGTYKTMYDVVQSTGSFTPNADQQAFLAKYVGKKDVTSESSAQWLLDYALGTKNEVMDKTIQDAQTKLEIDKTKLETIERDPESMGLFGSYYHHVAQQNPNSDVVENMGETYLEMASDAGQQDKKGAFTPKALAAQKALRSVESEFGGAEGIAKLINADQAAFDRLIAAREKNAAAPQKTLIAAANKRLTDDNTVLNQTNSRIGALQNIINQKGNETLMSGLLKSAGLASVDQAQTELTTLLGQRASQTYQIATDRQNLDKLSKGQLSAAPGMVTMVAPNGQTKQVPPDQVDHYISLGAKRQ